MGLETRTDYQHDARYHDNGIITIFDNGGVNEDVQSRGIVVEIGEAAMSATLIGEYTHPDKIFSDTQGNLQVLPNGNVFVGWGSEPYFSEFSKHGELLFDASFPSELESYRAFRFPWKGQPQDEPALGTVPRRSPPGRFSQDPGPTGWSPHSLCPKKGLRDRDNCTHGRAIHRCESQGPHGPSARLLESTKAGEPNSG
jgi:hypothetical protein